MTHRSNEINEKKFDTYVKKSPKSPIREYANIHSNVRKKKVTVIGNYMLKFVQSKNLSVESYIANILTNPGCTTENITDYIKPIITRKPYIILVHTGSNDLTNSVDTRSKVRKIVKAVEQMDGNNEIKLEFSSINVRNDRDLEKEINKTNTKLKIYCMPKGLIFLDIADIKENCLNNSKHHLNRKESTLLTKNIHKCFLLRFNEILFYSTCN